MANSYFFSNGTMFYNDDDENDRKDEDKFHSSSGKYRLVIQHERSKRKDNDEYHSRKKHSRKSESKPRKSEFDDARLFCDECQQYHENICPYHQQTYIPDKKVSKSTLKETDRFADLTCPDGIIIKTSTINKAGKGVFANKRFPKETFFGPYTGDRHTNFKTAQESGYAWSIADKHGKMVYIVDGRDPTTSNWMRYVSQLYVNSKETLEAHDICMSSGPNHIEQQNLLPVQYDRNMFYKTMRTIEPGEELFVYYGDDYARYLGIDPFVLEKNETKTDFDEFRDN